MLGHRVVWGVAGRARADAYLTPAQRRQRDIAAAYRSLAMLNEDFDRLRMKLHRPVIELSTLPGFRQKLEALKSFLAGIEDRLIALGVVYRPVGDIAAMIEAEINYVTQLPGKMCLPLSIIPKLVEQADETSNLLLDPIPNEVLLANILIYLHHRDILTLQQVSRGLLLCLNHFMLKEGYIALNKKGGLFKEVPAKGITLEQWRRSISLANQPSSFFQNIPFVSSLFFGKEDKSRQAPRLSKEAEEKGLHTPSSSI